MRNDRHQSFNVYQSVTDSIVRAIEGGAGEFQLPWHRSSALSGFPANVLTGSRYRGVNVVALWASAAVRGFSTQSWGTYRQWSRLGAQVRRGEKASVIVFYRKIETPVPDKETGEPHDAFRLVARASWVFNADQVDGYSPPGPPPIDRVALIDRADRFVAETEAEIRHGGSTAFYSHAADLIMIPNRAAFTGTATSTPTESYYGVLFHELVHWSGAELRLARDLSGRFGSAAYAVEELVAELGAAFLCAEFAVTPSPRADHAAYIANWLDVLKTDNRAIFTAASTAMTAVDYLLECSDGGPTDGDAMTIANPEQA